MQPEHHQKTWGEIRCSRVPASYKTPAVLLIHTVKSGKTLGSETIVWVKLSKELIGSGDDYIIINVYIPPQCSAFYSMMFTYSMFWRTRLDSTLQTVVI